MLDAVLHKAGRYDGSRYSLEEVAHAMKSLSRSGFLAVQISKGGGIPMLVSDNLHYVAYVLCLMHIAPL
jgi:hypothetical protein